MDKRLRFYLDDTGRYIDCPAAAQNEVREILTLPDGNAYANSTMPRLLKLLYGNEGPYPPHKVIEVHDILMDHPDVDQCSVVEGWRLHVSFGVQIRSFVHSIAVPNVTASQNCTPAEYMSHMLFMFDDMP